MLRSLLRQAGAFVVRKRRPPNLQSARRPQRVIRATPRMRVAGPRRWRLAWFPSLRHPDARLHRPPSLRLRRRRLHADPWLVSALEHKGTCAFTRYGGFLAADVAVTRRAYAALVPNRAGVPAPAPVQPRTQLAPRYTRCASGDHVLYRRAAGEGRLPTGFEGLTKVADVIHDDEMRRSLAPELQIGRDRMDAPLVTRIDEAKRRSATDYRTALAAVEVQQKRRGNLFDSFDAIVCLPAPAKLRMGWRRPLRQR